MIPDFKPYPAMKDSGVEWLGEVPEHWELRRTKTVLGVRSQKGFPDEPMLAATQTKGVVRKEQYENRTVLALKDLHLLKLVRVRDFVISLRSFQGGIEYAREQGIISPAYTILFAENPDDQEFLAHLFKSKPYIENLGLFVTGIRQGQNIDYEKLSRAEIPLPPLSEQTGIVRYLNYVDRRVRRYSRAKQKLIKLLEEQKQAIIHRAVTRGLDPDVPMKDSGVEWLGDVPEHWEVRRVKQCAKTISKGTTPSTEGREIVDSGPVRFLKAENVTSLGIQDSPLAFIDEETDRMLKRSRLHLGDVLFVIAGATLGKTSLVSKSILPANTNQAVAFIRPNSKIDSSYLEFWLQTPRIKEQIWLNAVQSAQPNLSMGDLGEFACPLPSSSEQTVIVQHLEDVTTDIDTAIARTHRKIELLSEYRTRLLADVVTGKLDVREAAENLPDEPVDIEEPEELLENGDDLPEEIDSIPQEVEA
jgi:type I restriction enzyme, S subunit